MTLAYTLALEQIIWDQWRQRLNLLLATKIGESENSFDFKIFEMCWVKCRFSERSNQTQNHLIFLFCINLFFSFCQILKCSLYFLPLWIGEHPNESTSSLKTIFFHEIANNFDFRSAFSLSYAFNWLSILQQSTKHF